MNNDKFDAITGDKFVCCCDCGKWFPSTNAFTKFYGSTAFMLCPKCTNKLEQEIRLYKVKEAPAADVVEVVRCCECLCYTPVDDNIGKCVFLIGKHQYVVPDGYCYLAELKAGVDNG